MARTIKGLTGTVTVTQYSASVTGASTDWDKSLEGTYIRINSNPTWYTINEVISETSLTLTRRYQEPSGSGLQFVIGDNQSFQKPQLILEPSGGIENDANRIGTFPDFDDNF